MAHAAGGRRRLDRKYCAIGDDVEQTAEAVLRYDITNRWSLIGFAGLGRVADTFGDVGSGDNHTAVGGGFRYLIARQ